MNKQGRVIDGKVEGGIEWVKTVEPDGIERQGATANPVGGCFHRCRWKMPDGTVAECYAETTANGAAQRAYPQGFEHHYWRPKVLEEILREKTPMRIFTDSMSDMFGRWVPAEQIQQCLDVYARAHWHTIIVLTKNAPRLLQFEFPPNVWVLASSPPDFFMGKDMSVKSKAAMLERALTVLREVNARRVAKGQPELVTGMSFEPLSQDYADLVIKHWGVLKWAIVGAASHGKKYFQPNPEYVRKLLRALDTQRVPVFFKGNLRGNEAAVPWREEFPNETREAKLVVDVPDYLKNAVLQVVMPGLKKREDGDE